MILIALLFTVSFAPADTCYVTDSDFIKSKEAACGMMKTFQDADNTGIQWVSTGQNADGDYMKTQTEDDCLEPEGVGGMGSPHKIIDAPSNCIFAKLFDEATFKSPEKDCWKKANPQKGAICFLNLVPPPQQVVQQQAPVQQNADTCESIDAQMKAPGVKMGKMLELVATCDGMSLCKHNQIGSGVHECVPSGTANRVGMGFSESKNYIPAGCFLAFVSVASYVLVKQCRANKDDYQTLMSDEDQL